MITKKDPDDVKSCLIRVRVTACVCQVESA